MYKKIKKNWWIYSVRLILTLLIISLIYFFYPKDCGSITSSEILTEYDGKTPFVKCNCVGITGKSKGYPIKCFGICIIPESIENCEYIVPQEYNEYMEVYLDSICKDLKITINKMFDDANFCTSDLDCKIISLGGKNIEFGCYKYINKNIHTLKFYDNLKDYSKLCTNKIDYCSPIPDPVCENNICVSEDSIKETNNDCTVDDSCEKEHYEIGSVCQFDDNCFDIICPLSDEPGCELTPMCSEDNVCECLYDCNTIY